MVYIPRSKISKKQTSADNVLFIKTDGVPYKGPFIETSDGRFFAGHNNTIVGPELIKNPIDKPTTSTPKLFSNSKATRKYQNLRNDIKSKLEKATSVPLRKPPPTIIDYRIGRFQRYFFKRINETYYQEIEKKTYVDILEKKPIYYSNLYDIGTIIWYIRGNDVFKQNALILKKSEKKYPFINYLFPILNEYQLPEKTTKENLNTRGGELYYSDGKEYIGLYHIHPSKGPMVGAKHTETPHDHLYYTNQLPEIPNQSYQEFSKNYNKITCYKCVNNQVVSIKRSKMLGCKEGSYSDYETAVDSCSKSSSTKSPTKDSNKESGY